MSRDDFLASRWLIASFLKPRGLDAQDARPLYGYRCSDQEFEYAAGALRRALVGTADRGRNVSALFCLYAAEWWRRNYAGGAWAWEPMFDNIGSRYEWNLARDLTQQGLGFWRRPLRMRGTNREFLLSIILEAGLPLKVVRSGRGALAAFLRRVLAELDQYGVDEDAARKLAAFHGRMLPASFRSGEMYALVADLVLTALRYRDQLPTDLPPGHAVGWLDTNRAGWREQFPLAVDDDAARELLAGLIKDSLSLRDRARQLGSLVERTLRRTEDGWRLEAEFQVDGAVPPGSMPGLETAQRSGAIRARLFAAGTIERHFVGPLALARLDGDGGEQRWRLEPYTSARSAFPLAHGDEVRLRVVANGEDLAAFTAPGGEPLPPAPWTFETIPGQTPEEVERLRFLGSGSVRSRRPFLFVAGPSAESLSPADGGVIVFVGRIVDTDYKLFRISGVVRYSGEIDGPQIVLSTLEEEERAERLVPRGAAPRWRTDDLAFLGTPEFWETRDGAISRRVHREDIRWRPAAERNMRWRVMEPSGLPSGAMEVGLVRANEIMDRVRLVVLPSALTINSLPIDSRRGSIAIRGTDDGVVLIERPGGAVRIEATRVDGGCHIALEADGEAPAEIGIDIIWPNDRGRLRSRVAFPTRGGGFVDGAGRWLTPSVTLALDGLYGVRALAPSGSGSATLFGWLQARDVPGRDLWLRRRFTDECSLASLRQVFLRLLAASQDVDASVILVVQSDSGDGSTIRLSRLDLELKVDREGSVEIDPQSAARLDANAGLSVEILGRLMNNLTRDEVPLASVPNADPPRWSIDHAKSCSGSWLIYGRVAGRYRFRPRMISIDSATTQTAHAHQSQIARFALIPEFAKRQALIAERLGSIAEDPAAEDWEELDRALAAIQGRLPLATLDYFRLFADQPAPLAMFLARSTGAATEAVLQMEDELPFCWATLPLDAWFAAFRVSKKHHANILMEAGLEASYADEIVTGTLAKIVDAEPVLAGTAALIRERLNQVLPEDRNVLALGDPVKRPFVEHLINGQRMNALRRNSDMSWPDSVGFREIGLSLPPENLQYAEHCLPVLDAPFAAAAIAGSGRTAEARFIRAVLQCREFDPLWFEEAYPLALVLAAAQREPIQNWPAS